MEAMSLLTSPSFPPFPLSSSLTTRNFSLFSPIPKSWLHTSNFTTNNNKYSKLVVFAVEPAYSTSTIRNTKFVVDEAAAASGSSNNTRDMFPKVDKSGRFCSPRAARELALSIAYAACLEGSDPVRLFEKRTNARRDPGYEFDKNLLLEFNHMNFGGPPITVDTNEEADQLLRVDQNESMLEAEVLSAPPKLVYSTLILRFARKLLVAVGDSWDNHVLVIEKVVPQNWKNKPAGRILELCILHLAMSEITVLGTRHQIVINEAVDLAKRFCDGSAPRIINGCLRTFVKDLEESSSTTTADLNSMQKVSS